MKTAYYSFGASKVLAITTTTARTTIPKLSADLATSPLLVLLSCSVPVHVRPGSVTVTATLSDPLMPPEESWPVFVHGHTDIAAIEPAGGTGGELIITALENE